MASLINITDRIKKQVRQIQVGDEVLTVNTAFEKMVEIEALERRKDMADTEKMLKIMEILLGKDYKKVKDLELDIDGVKVLFTAIMATVNNCTYEEMESRFQGYTE